MFIPVFLPFKLVGISRIISNVQSFLPHYHVVFLYIPSGQLFTLTYKVRHTLSLIIITFIINFKIMIERNIKHV